jgi:hypothetical protein
VLYPAGRRDHRLQGGEEGADVSTFEERLAQLSDRVRPLDDGLARELMALAGDIQDHLDRARAAHYEKATDLFQKWSEFLNATVEDRDRQHAVALAEQRRRLARRIAGDPRWQGGYAEALALLTKESTDGDR